MIFTEVSMATTDLRQPLPGRYIPAVLRHWNTARDEEELWFFLEIKINKLNLSSITMKAVSAEAESVIGRPVQIVTVAESLNPNPAPIQQSAHWIAGPITEREAVHIKELSMDSS